VPRRRVAIIASLAGFLVAGGLAALVAQQIRATEEASSSDGAFLITTDQFAACREAIFALDPTGTASADSMRVRTLQEFAYSKYAVLFEGDEASPIDTSSASQVDALAATYSAMDSEDTEAGIRSVAVTMHVRTDEHSGWGSCLVRYENEGPRVQAAWLDIE
jgi:hypothetical protein